MFKLLFVILLIYISYRMFNAKQLDTTKKDALEEEENDEFTDYEEIE